MSAIFLTSFIRWNVTNCITLPLEHMMQSDSLFYLAKPTKLIITAAWYFIARFHRHGLCSLLFDEALFLFIYVCLGVDFHREKCSLSMLVRETPKIRDLLQHI